MGWYKQNFCTHWKKQTIPVTLFIGINHFNELLQNQTHGCLRGIPVYQLCLSENRRGKSNQQKLFSGFFHSDECIYVTMLIFYCGLECGHLPSHFSETCGNLELNTLPVFSSVTLVIIGQVKTVPSSI